MTTALDFGLHLDHVTRPLACVVENISEHLLQVLCLARKGNVFAHGKAAQFQGTPGVVETHTSYASGRVIVLAEA